MITRRRFLTLSAALAAAAAGGTANVEATPRDSAGLWKTLADNDQESDSEFPRSGSKKKGLGLGVRNPNWAEILKNLRCKWCYTWLGQVPSDLPDGMEFIPMVRSQFMEAQRISNIATQAKAHGISELLGLNEPDTPKQDNMSVGDALDAWPLLMETGMRLGSPGCVHPDNTWMLDFMEGVEERKLRVDFVCVHSYGSPNPRALINRLEKVHKLYHRPLWITEFGVGDWKAQSVEENIHAPETVLRFMENVIPMLEGLDFLERYAWFPSKPDSIPLGTSALFDFDGALTPLGECYRDA